MNPSRSSAVTDLDLPPLPESSGPSPGAGAPSSGAPGFLASLISGIAPVKASVDQIRAACQQIVQSGAVPGAEQICGQIVALATQLIPMAAQNALQPGAGGGMGGMGMGAMLPPPGGPVPLG